jgi:hypothetical protein
VRAQNAALQAKHDAVCATARAEYAYRCAERELEFAVYDEVRVKARELVEEANTTREAMDAVSISRYLGY